MLRLIPFLVLSLVFMPSITAIADDTAVAEEPTRFDYHSIRGRQAPAAARDIFEGELHMSHRKNARVQSMRDFGAGWSGDAQMLWDGVVGDSMETTFRIDTGGRFRLSLQLTKAPDYGRFSVQLNGNEVRKDVDLYAPLVALAEPLDLGEFTLQAGEQKLVFTLTGANERAKKFADTGYLLGLDFLRLVKPDAPAGTRPAGQPGDVASGRSLTVPVNVTFDTVKPLMTRFCYECHSGDDAEGKINLKQLASKAAFLTNIDVTRKVARVLDRREMPPKNEQRPTQAGYEQLASWFDSLVDEYIRTSPSHAPVVMRRMNRFEYNNAVRDLLQLKGDLYPLPEKVIRPGKKYFDPAAGRFPDTVQVGNRALGKNQIEQKLLTGVSPFAIDLQAEHGFNNRGEQLSLSPILLESLLKLARSIVDSPEFDGYSGLTATLFSAPGNVSAEQQVKIAAERIHGFLRRAFRSRVDEATARRYGNFFARELARTDSFSQSMKNVVAAVLASPRFLYIMERPVLSAPKADESQANTGDADRPDKASNGVTAHELATRLSMYLWSSIPDDELLRLADNGDLLKPNVLEAQIRRMLEDPRCQALSQNFARQWLRLDQLITAVPDFDRFQVYYSRIGCEQWKFGLQTMVEPLLLFESILVEDRSIMLLVDSNYSYRSNELQSWYKDEVPFGNRANRNRFNTNQQTYRRVQLDTRREGGVMTSAAVLAMTSAPLRTKPITRGAWVATVVFNQPPPPPPDVIPEIEADDAAIEAQGLTLRERLKQHQVNQSCVSCHSKIDPLGFALENYDAIGRWRDKYRSGLPIDAGGELFGQAKFTDVVGLKDAILDHPEWFMRGFSEHMLSYALGRELQINDKPAVDRIVREVMADHGKFSTVVIQIATSYPFLHKSHQLETTPKR